ncbi:hypothetical protein AWJ20_4976 [Sugiyamaella lignohabitans]|uniref:Uncharacterized protein n=1 Tax=Sugiyamaella lignohabitans TaxID=796027 RepID=A0A161HF19_9ASCO|nr:uncharacterized protein AWJ20_4976 [Sugiyamaella lignohabitans]ANB14020.1 hypothetical protein AWJ20_4976 [Sugiyamaella lignohabitans]
MRSFYKSVLEEEDRRNEAIIEATKSVATVDSDKIKNVDNGEENALLTKAEKINKEVGYQKVQINDSGELVDDRQLLSAGLNVVKKRPVDNTKSTNSGRSISISDTKKPATYRKDRRRETELIERQLLAQEKRKRQEIESSKERIISQVKSRKTDDSISQARERYLARKKANQNTTD